MKKYKELVNEISSYFQENYKIEQELKSEISFIYISELIIESKINTLVKGKGLSCKNLLSKVYPYLTKNILINNYPLPTSLRESILAKIEIDDLTDSIGAIYEYCIPKSKRKDYGQFYTRSPRLIESILDNIGYIDAGTKGKRILDPSVGSGIFLIDAIRRIKRYYNETGQSNISLLNDVSENIYGIDIDPFACYICELNLIIELLDSIVLAYQEDCTFKMKRLNIITGDYTDISTNIEGNDKSESDFKFDYIVGNPPYITMYGRRSRNMTEEKRQYFNTNYDFVINKKGNNKFNSVMFFIERAIKMTKNNHSISFIIDIAFFETAYKDIRKYILDNCQIVSITTNLTEFEGVGSGQIILHLVKQSNENIRNNHMVRWNEDGKLELNLICQRKWYNEEDEYKFYKPRDEKEEELLLHLEMNNKLIDYFPDKQLRTCAALTGRTADFMVSEQDYLDDINNLIFPYLEGSKGVESRFCIPKPTAYFKYDYNLQQKISEEFKVELEKLGVKNKKRIALGDYVSYCSPKIFIRQSATQIIATFTTDKFAANNSIYILTNKDKTEKNIQFMKYVLGILNSDLITYYARKKRIIRMEKGKTPQIKLADLKKLPLKIDNKVFNDLVHCVDHLLVNNLNKDALCTLNQLVYKIYNISDNQISIINQELNE